MRKTSIIILVLILTLVGCAKKDINDDKEEVKPEPQKIVAKLDADKPFIYSDIKEEYEQQDLIYDFLKKYNFTNLDLIPKDIYLGTIQNITLNFDSESSKKIQDDLNKSIQSLEQSERDYEIMKGTFALINYAETDKTISFITFKSLLPKVPSDVGEYEIQSYIFNKENGKILTNNEILDFAKITSDDIIEQMITHLNPLEYEDEKGLIDYKPSIDSCDVTKYEKCMIIAPDNSFFVNQDGKLYVILNKKFLTDNTMDPDAVFYYILPLDK